MSYLSLVFYLYSLKEVKIYTSRNEKKTICTLVLKLPFVYKTLAIITGIYVSDCDRVMSEFKLQS